MTVQLGVNLRYQGKDLSMCTIMALLALRHRAFVAKNAEYTDIVGETYQSGIPSVGFNGIVVRPVPNQQYPTSLLVECSRKLSTDYPVSARFRMRVKLTDRMGSGQFFYASYRWPFDVLG
jgi:hypothetical protein